MRLLPISDTRGKLKIVNDQAAHDEMEAALNYISRLPFPDTKCHSLSYVFS